ncbi:MAG TPA: DNA internalization-related competence protein ComEC/Rec2 [Candidatus Tumulicola sp.]
MQPYALVACAAVAVASTLASTQALSPTDRVCAAASIAGAFLLAARLARPNRGLMWALLAVVTLAVLNGAIRGEPAATETIELRTQRYAATVIDVAGQDAVLQVDAGPRLLAALPTPIPPIGSHVVVLGRLAEFDGPRNPGEPSERAIQHERGFDARLETAHIVSQAPGDGSDWRVLLARVHRWAHQQLAARLGEPQATVLAGELWGERSELPPNLKAEFQETGTVHVLVTAGLHLGAVVALVVALLTAFALPRAATCAIAIAAAWLFVVWSGAQLPSVRAACMATAVLAARACGRASLSWNALALAAIGICAFRPASVATASFALSFSCVGAIFACASPIEHWLESHVALPARVREALVLSIATQLGTWPLGAAVFLQFSPYAIAANVAVVPCVAVTMGLAASQLAVAWSEPLAQALANLDNWLLEWMLGVVRTVASLPGSSLPMTPPPAWCIGLYDATIVFAPILARRGAAAGAILLLLASATFVLWPPRTTDMRLHITMLDVGQADSIVVQTPRGHAIAIDAGGRLERGGPAGDSIAERVGERTVVPFLLRRGIHRLDVLAISHPHGDHAGGAAPILRRIGVDEIIDSGQSYGGHAYRDAVATARAKSIPILLPRSGSSWSTDDGVRIQFIGPSLPLVANTKNNINENSLAFTLRYGTFCMLFTGDAGAIAEQRFLREDVDLRCAILKVGHHGSAYSSTPAFLEAVRPTYALISVGRHNLFGHPAQSTIEALQQAGATIYRTDQNGAIEVTSDGFTFDVRPMLLP